ncbi:MAG: hypothetical protein EZS28_031429 [Streblomastix strix]|uniref:Uncharacterized protein n=1 Tax=Streblomastix strix TaxID=222440 RepID=A0A5J4URR3_9EUKA|nr:MAG: hypothetical protein EZS28_031429 [Streblomastix strix]
MLISTDLHNEEEFLAIVSRTVLHKSGSWTSSVAVDIYWEGLLDVKIFLRVFFTWLTLDDQIYGQHFATAVTTEWTKWMLNFEVSVVVVTTEDCSFQRILAEYEVMLGIPKIRYSSLSMSGFNNVAGYIEDEACCQSLLIILEVLFALLDIIFLGLF